MTVDCGIAEQLDSMDEYDAVTPPLVDPLTEAANAHLAALAQAEVSNNVEADTEVKNLEHIGLLFNSNCQLKTVLRLLK